MRLRWTFFALPHLASSCLILPLLASSYLILPHLASSYLILPLLASFYLILPHLASSCLFLPLLASFYLILPHLALSCLILPHLTSSCLILPRLASSHNCPMQASQPGYCDIDSYYFSRNTELPFGLVLSVCIALLILCVSFRRQGVSNPKARGGAVSLHTTLVSNTSQRFGKCLSQVSFNSRPTSEI